MAKRSKIYRIDIGGYRRGGELIHYAAVGRDTRKNTIVRHYYRIFGASLTRAYNALLALTRRQEQK